MHGRLQEPLARICIPQALDEEAYATFHSYPPPAGGGAHSLLLRHLLAAASEDYCGEGKQSLWPVSLQHDVHYFIFAVACTHIVYCTVVIYLTLVKVRCA